MIYRGRIQEPNEGESTAFVAQGKKKNAKKGKGKPSKSRRPPQPIKIPRIQEGEIEMLSATIVIERVTMHCPEKRNAPRRNSSRSYNNNRGFNKSRSYERRDDRRRNERRRNSLDDREDSYCPAKRSRNSRYEGNGTNQSEYVLISALSSSFPSDSWDS